MPRMARKKKTRSVSTRGYARIAMARVGRDNWENTSGIASPGVWITFVARAYPTTPRTSDPQSPKKIRAGAKLKTKNPSVAPNIVKERMAAGI